MSAFDKPFFWLEIESFVGESDPSKRRPTRGRDVKNGGDKEEEDMRIRQVLVRFEIRSPIVELDSSERGPTGGNEEAMKGGGRGS